MKSSVQSAKCRVQNAKWSSGKRFISHFSLCLLHFFSKRGAVESVGLGADETPSAAFTTAGSVRRNALPAASPLPFALHTRRSCSSSQRQGATHHGTILVKM